MNVLPIHTRTTREPGAHTVQRTVVGALKLESQTLVRHGGCRHSTLASEETAPSSG